ncbi:response regulator [Desulfatitalea tepidiphila]|uniref:response regulator n=1 Tax=Desulfatitalea tepidiphila TaxID=1185843 RepID=UPI0006B45418|nr:response regulator [Desulfatitalea tepidiphila]
MTIAKVMLVDDEKPFVDTMIKRLNKREVDIVPAYNGQEALDKLAEDSTIEVVILDIKMPVMDGMEALNKIKSKHPLVEVIMLTGHATVETGIEGMKMGAFDYLMKPCNADELVEKVQQAAAKKRQHEEKIMEARIKAITLRKP